METYHPDEKAYPNDVRIVPIPRRVELQKEADRLKIPDSGAMNRDELHDAVIKAKAKKGKKK